MTTIKPEAVMISQKYYIKNLHIFDELMTGDEIRKHWDLLYLGYLTRPEIMLRCNKLAPETD